MLGATDEEICSRDAGVCRGQEGNAYRVVGKDGREPYGAKIVHCPDKLGDKYRIRRSEQCSGVKAVLMQLSTEGFLLVLFHHG